MDGYVIHSRYIYDFCNWKNINTYTKGPQIKWSLLISLVIQIFSEVIDERQNE